MAKVTKTSDRKWFPARKGTSQAWKDNWKIFVDEISVRDNFKESHLRTLEILCDLLEEYTKLSDFVKENGYSYESCTKEGVTWKKFPEAEMRQKCVSNISMYCKLLDLKLFKDKANEPDQKVNEWEDD